MDPLDLAEVSRELDEWSQHPRTLLGTEQAEHLLGVQMPRLINELRQSRLLLERSRPQVGW